MEYWRLFRELDRECRLIIFFHMQSKCMCGTSIRLVNWLSIYDEIEFFFSVFSYANMLRLRFHASWLPDEHNAFWIVLDRSMNIETIEDLIRYFVEQEKSLADYYQFHLSKRTTKSKYLKAFVNDCILPPNARVNEILSDNDQI